MVVHYYNLGGGKYASEFCTWFDALWFYHRSECTWIVPGTITE